MSQMLADLLSTRKSQIIVIGFISALFLIPTGTLLLSKRMNANPPEIKKYDNTVTKIASNSAQEVPKALTGLDSALNPSPTPQPSDNLQQAIAQIIAGPTLNFKVKLEGRPEGKQAAKLFVGLAEGSTVVKNPKYILSFSVDVPDSGAYSGLSLAGLNQGATYTAYIKGPAQIATASAFLVTPSASTLNNGDPLNLITGDLNEDNVIDNADYIIAKKAYGSKPGDANWNPNVDFNLDGIINNYDLAYILKNMGQIGQSGAWYSKPPVATPSGSLNTGGPTSPIGGPSLGGHWLFVPDY